MVRKQNDGDDFERVIVLDFEDCFTKACSSEVGRQNRPPTMGDTSEEIGSSRDKVASIVGHVSLPETVGCDKFAPANAGTPGFASIIACSATEGQANGHAALFYETAPIGVPALAVARLSHPVCCALKDRVIRRAASGPEKFDGSETHSF